MSIKFLNLTIKSRRKNLGITQGQMAMRLGITRQAYNRIENGETMLISNKLPEIAKLLGMSEDGLLFESLKDFADKRELYGEVCKDCLQMYDRIKYLEKLVQEQSDYIDTLKKARQL